MTNQNLVDNALHEIGFQVLNDEPAGLFGTRKRVASLESGATFLADVVDAAGDDFLRGLALTGEHAKSFDKTFVVSPLAARWWGDTYCQILTVDHDWVPLSRLPREEFAATPQQAIVVAMGAVKVVEYLARLGVCHLAICPSTVYKNGHQIRLGEMWTIQLAHGQSYCPRDSTSTFKFIRNDPRLLTAPEFRDEPGEVGTRSDLYSLALLIVNLFSLTPVSPSEVLEADDLRQLISQRCPDLNEAFVKVLNGALQRDVHKRQHIIMFQESVAGQAEDLGVAVPQSYYEKSIPSPWDLRKI